MAQRAIVGAVGRAVPALVGDLADCATTRPVISPLFPLNAVFDLWLGGQNRPVVFDIDEVAPALRELDRGYAEIRAEVDTLLEARAEIPRYHDLDPLQYRISGAHEPDRDWRIFMLYILGRMPSANRARCPRTAALCDRIPHLFQAFFSILEPGKSIPPHCGPYRGYLRYHLGLKVPREHPPSIRIRDHVHEWREGGSILFDDSWEHEVYNASDDIRVVLVVDIIRPMPPVPHAINVAMQRLIGPVYSRGILRLDS
jgi:aspartyl/asparaginyl beta-hydroxylase (cupin superfamily)